MNKRVLYDLAGADSALRFSPYCWRIKLALAHKGLEFDTVPWRFAERGALAFSGQSRVPVLIDGVQIVSDSWRIAQYLEQTYPKAPSLFGGEVGLALSRFVAQWVDTVLNPEIASFVMADIEKLLDPESARYFRESREARFGKTLEQFCDQRESRVAEFRQKLTPLRQVLTQQRYLGGDQPLYADYCAFSGFQWARCVSGFGLLVQDDPILHWAEHIAALHDGLAGAAQGMPFTGNLSRLEG